MNIELPDIFASEDKSGLYIHLTREQGHQLALTLHEMLTRMKIETPGAKFIYSIADQLDVLLIGRTSSTGRQATTVDRMRMAERLRGNPPTPPRKQILPAELLMDGKVASEECGVHFSDCPGGCCS